MLLKNDLIKAIDLKQKFSLINQHLYGKLKHTDTDTRTRSREIINLLLCKLVDEIDKQPDQFMDFSIRPSEPKSELLSRIQLFFKNKVQKTYPDIIGENERINLNEDLLFFIIQELQEISLLQSSREIFRDAFEVFVSKILKEEGGQFFTPSNIIKFMVNYLDPSPGSMILDPACGHGGFLLEIIEFLWNKLTTNGTKNQREKNKIIDNLFGIDKDAFLVKICRLYIEILSGQPANVFCEDSLDTLSYRNEAKKVILNRSFDYVLTNPPFGSKIPINEEDILKNFELGHLWRTSSEGTWKKQKRLLQKQPPQILFIERCVQLLCEGGKMGIILPEGIFGNPTDRYIWEYLESKGKILGIISLDQNAFQPYTCNKTSILFFEKTNHVPNDYDIDFAIVENVGHDKDGKILYQLNKDGSKKVDHNGEFIVNDDLFHLNDAIEESEPFNYLKDQKIFKIKNSQIKDKIYIPSYYEGVEKTLRLLAEDENFELMSIQQLIDLNIIYTNRNGYLPRGDEIGSQMYGLGDIPFIRTSDIYNWEINLDSNKKTSEEIYLKYKEKQNVEEGDILLVKDGGSNLIGKTAYVSQLTIKIIIQSHIYQIKVLKNEKAIDPYLLLYLLNLDLVQDQIKAITFVQGTIATIGNRIMEIMLPIPTDINKRVEISQFIREIINKKIEIRSKISNLTLNSFF
jgi:type I restriction enzyme M protein